MKPDVSPGIARTDDFATSIKMYFEGSHLSAIFPMDGLPMNKKTVRWRGPTTSPASIKKIARWLWTKAWYRSLASWAFYWVSRKPLLFAAKFHLNQHIHHQKELAIKDDDKCALCYVTHWAKTGEFRK